MPLVPGLSSVRSLCVVHHYFMPPKAGLHCSVILDEQTKSKLDISINKLLVTQVVGVIPIRIVYVSRFVLPRGLMQYLYGNTCWKISILQTSSVVFYWHEQPDEIVLRLH